jgi:hypothetical protein
VQWRHDRIGVGFAAAAARAAVMQAPDWRFMSAQHNRMAMSALRWLDAVPIGRGCFNTAGRTVYDCDLILQSTRHTRTDADTMPSRYRAVISIQHAAQASRHVFYHFVTRSTGEDDITAAAWYAHAAGVPRAELDVLEATWRLRDTVGGLDISSIPDKTRAAFEACWLAGEPDAAMRIVQDDLDMVG